MCKKIKNWFKQKYNLIKLWIHIFFASKPPKPHPFVTLQLQSIPPPFFYWVYEWNIANNRYRERWMALRLSLSVIAYVLTRIGLGSFLYIFWATVVSYHEKLLQEISSFETSIHDYLTSFGINPDTNQEILDYLTEILRLIHRVNTLFPAVLNYLRVTYPDLYAQAFPNHELLCDFYIDLLAHYRELEQLLGIALINSAIA